MRREIDRCERETHVLEESEVAQCGMHPEENKIVLTIPTARREYEIIINAISCVPRDIRQIILVTHVDPAQKKENILVLKISSFFMCKFQNEVT